MPSYDRFYSKIWHFKTPCSLADVRRFDQCILPGNHTGTISLCLHKLHRFYKDSTHIRPLHRRTLNRRTRSGKRMCTRSGHTRKFCAKNVFQRRQKPKKLKMTQIWGFQAGEQQFFMMLKTKYSRKLSRSYKSRRSDTDLAYKTEWYFRKPCLRSLDDKHNQTHHHLYSHSPHYFRKVACI